MFKFKDSLGFEHILAIKNVLIVSSNKIQSEVLARYRKLISALK